MVKPEMIANGDFEGITKLVRGAVDTMLGFKLRHVGINSANADVASDSASTLGKFFSFPEDQRSASIFVSPELEIMKQQGRGTHGHIAIETNNVDRAVYHLKRRGVEFDMDSAQYAPDGSMKFIYLANEIDGFAYHLVK